MELLSNPIVVVVVVALLGVLLRYNRKSINSLYQSRGRSTSMKNTKSQWQQFEDWFYYKNEHPRQTFDEMVLAAAMASEQVSQAPVAGAPVARPVTQPVAVYQGDTSWLTNAQPEVQSIKLSTVAQEQNVGVFGPKGSGKTTVLRTILHQRASEACYAIDPHASPNKWPCTTIGGGLNWGEVGKALLGMEASMKKRFGELNQGTYKEGEFPRRTFVGDEFLAIATELNGKNNTVDAGKLLISRLTQGRKVSECILVAAQNDTTAALGISGNADVKSCFDYLVFLGGLVDTRAKYHGCPASIIEASKQDKRRAVAWHPERNNWYVLIYDLEPIKEGQVLSVSQVVPAGSQEPVPANVPILSGSEHGNQFSEMAEPVTGTDGFDVDTIKALHFSGWSRNEIAAKMRGRRETKLTRIREALESETVNAA